MMHGAVVAFVALRYADAFPKQPFAGSPPDILTIRHLRQCVAALVPIEHLNADVGVRCTSRPKLG